MPCKYNIEARSCLKKFLQNLKAKDSLDTIKRQIIFSMSVSLLNPHALLDTIGVIGTSSLQFSGHEKMVFGQKKPQIVAARSIN